MITKAQNKIALVEIINNSSVSVDLEISHIDNAVDFVENNYHFDDFTNDQFNHKLNSDNNNYENRIRKQEVMKLIRTEHLNSEEKQAIIINLCHEYSNLLHTKGQPLTFTSQTKHTINTIDETTIYTKTYQYPHIHKEEIQRQIKELIDNGVIQHSSSPWSSPVWIVDKKQDASKVKKLL